MRFNHIFKLTNENETHREYKCDNVNINIDFISGSALRVAVFNDNAEMLPTFTVNPNNSLSSLGRSSTVWKNPVTMGLSIPEQIASERRTPAHIFLVQLSKILRVASFFGGDAQRRTWRRNFA